MRLVRLQAVVEVNEGRSFVCNRFIQGFITPEAEAKE